MTRAAAVGSKVPESSQLCSLACGEDKSEQELSACEAGALSGSRVPMAQKGVGFVIFIRSLVYHLCSQRLEEVTAFLSFLVGNQSLSA